ncbi:PTS sugar transporter subunit IIA [Endozoicomonadaceae bacterium StTr2]
MISPSRALCNVHGISKKRTLELVANQLHEQLPAFNAKELFANLVSREKLGTTALGEGVALPHCRLSGCEQPVGLLLKLATPIDFDAADQQPVDLVFALIVPKDAHEEHLLILQDIATRFNSPEFRQNLRQTATADELFTEAVKPLPPESS